MLSAMVNSLSVMSFVIMSANVVTALGVLLLVKSMMDIGKKNLEKGQELDELILKRDERMQKVVSLLETIIKKLP